MPESYRALNARQDEKFALHGSSEPQCALPSIRGPPHNDLRQFLLSQSPKYFSNSSIFFISWGSWASASLAHSNAHVFADARRRSRCKLLGGKDVMRGTQATTQKLLVSADADACQAWAAANVRHYKGNGESGMGQRKCCAPGIMHAMNMHFGG